MKKSPLRRVSKKRAKQIRDYSKIRNKFLENAPFCEFPECCNRSTEIHHINHRENTKLLDTRYFLAVCRMHHSLIHAYPMEARAMGFLK